jgi:hypothetical protein
MGTPMIGSSDTEAEERAELLALRAETALRRKELGETVAAITGKLAGADPRAWARQAASAAARRAVHGARAAASRAVRSHPWQTAAAGAGTCLLLAAAAWRVGGRGAPAPAAPWPVRHRRARRRRSRRR